MKSITDKIKQECYKSKNLREMAWGVSYEESLKIREKQQEHWKKFNFYKNLEKAMGDKNNGKERIISFEK